VRVRRTVLLLGAVLAAGAVAAALATAGPATHTVRITSGPSGTTDSHNATFTFTSSEDARFTCSLDGSSSSCGTGKSGSVSYSSLKDGKHSFTVTGVAIRLGDSASDSWAWSIESTGPPPPPPRDTTPPETTITSAPAGNKPSDEAVLMFEANEPSTFTCTLDGKRASCASPLVETHLARGKHHFEVFATDRAGNADRTPAKADWTVGNARAVLVASSRPLRLRGPIVFRPNGKVKRPFPGNRSTDDDGDVGERPHDQPGDDDCRVIACKADPGRPGTRSAAPRAGPYAMGLTTRENDPQIAASTTHLVVTTNRTIRYYDKAGTLVTTDKDGQPFTGELAVASIFGAFFSPRKGDPMNTGLNLPGSLKCDPGINALLATGAQKPKVKDCIQDVYDARVVFDPFRKRFWLVAQARNNSAGSYEGLPSAAEHPGRRDKQLIAVSRSEDPRDGWYIYWTESTLDDGSCNGIGSSPGPAPICPGSTYRPGDAADYPSIGVSKDYVTTTIGVVNVNPWNKDSPGPSYTNVNVFPPDRMAAGKACPRCGWSYGRVAVLLDNGIGGNPVDVGALAGIAAPALQHGAVPSGWTLLAQNNPAENQLLVLGFRKAEASRAGPPPLHGAFVFVPGSASQVNDLPQKPTAAVPSPQRVGAAPIGSLALKAVARGQRLYVSWMDCRKWTIRLSECATAGRLVAVNAVTLLKKPLTPLFLDRLFGPRDLLDAAGTVVYYGYPSVEVNKAGDVVVTYTVAGNKNFLSTRYAVRPHGTTSFLPSAVLKAGQTPATQVFALDTSGASVDPVDDTGVWIINAYTYQPGNVGWIDYAFGKILGGTRADLAVLGGGGIALPRQIPGGGSAQVGGLVRNGGDHRSKPTRGTIKLLGHGKRVTIGTFAVPGLAPGKSFRFKVTANVPGTIPSGRYEVEVDVARRGKEYSARNNKGHRSVVIKKAAKG
jgi:hypothetical protein